MDTYAVILAGDPGLQLWPRARSDLPKFLLPLLSDGSTLQHTVRHLQPLFAPEQLLIVTTAVLAPLIRQHLPEIPAENVLVEPFGRGTAPCLMLTTLWYRQRGASDALLVVLPADHLISNIGEFHLSLEHALWAAERFNAPILLGHPPERPETRFGYVQIEEHPAEELAGRGFYRVRTFAEKPDRATAQRFLESGDFLWYSGIIVARSSVLWSMIRHSLPEHAAILESVAQQLDAPEALEVAYRQLRPISFEHGVLEKAPQQTLLLRCSFDWSDLGTWDEVYRLMLKDPRNNVLEGDVVTLNTSGCYVSASGKPLVLVGVEDLIVVDSDSALLICRRGQSEQLDELIRYLRRKRMHRLL
jgi:mannose-1-phosphate guanylyltransferase